MKGIIFRGDNVLRILDGRKMQTRRLILETNPSDGDVEESDEYPGEYFQWRGGERSVSFLPRYHLGETLYCKETWAIGGGLLDCPCLNYRTGDQSPILKGEGASAGLWFRASRPEVKITDDQILAAGLNHEGWRSALHMPEWASRCHIKITEIRAQRLQEISEEDCYAEGIADWKTPEQTFSPRVRFKELWDSISPKHPWANNDWIWVFTFEKL